MTFTQSPLVRRLWWSSLALGLIGSAEIGILAFAQRRPVLLLAALPLLGAAWYAWRRVRSLDERRGE